LKNDFSPEAEKRQREIISEINARNSRIEDIMKRHGLRAYSATSYFKSSEEFVYAYGYDAEEYAIS